jgi:hypothetical protein
MHHVVFHAMYHVVFHASARTTLHYHESEQILVATNGEGIVGLIEGTKVTDFEIDENNIILLEKEGDTVCVPAYKLHFHGAIGRQQDKKDFSHIAIRKIHVNGKDGIIKKAENKWEHDLIVEETGIKDPHEIMSLAKGIAEKVQKAVSRKLETLQT